LRVAAALNAGDTDHIAEWFTEDFKLHEPGVPVASKTESPSLCLVSRSTALSMDGLPRTGVSHAIRDTPGLKAGALRGQRLGGILANRVQR
jgi:hypothetical protein